MSKETMFQLGETMTENLHQMLVVIGDDSLKAEVAVRPTGIARYTWGYRACGSSCTLAFRDALQGILEIPCWHREML